MGLHGLWPAHQHFKTHQEKVLEETEKIQIKSNVWALS